MARRVVTLWALVITWGAGLGLLLVVGLQGAVPVRDLLVDPATARGSDWYAGFVTSLGVLAWSVAASGCAATAYAAALAGRPAAVRAFRGAAALFAVLLADDLFLLHSDLVPQLLGVPKVSVLAGLGALAGAWALPNALELARTRWELLGASVVAFATSLAVDIFVPGGESGLRLLIEDGAKFLGVLALAVWSVTCARDIIASIVTDPHRTPGTGSGTGTQPAPVADRAEAVAA